MGLWQGLASLLNARFSDVSLKKQRPSRRKNVCPLAGIGAGQRRAKVYPKVKPEVTR
jgi:hypothetical protein